MESLSSDFFQYNKDEIFGPIEQCWGTADDLIVFGYSEEDHNRVLFVVLHKTKCVGLHFNSDKCIFCYTPNSILWNDSWGGRH